MGRPRCKGIGKGKNVPEIDFPTDYAYWATRYVQAQFRQAMEIGCILVDRINRRDSTFGQRGFLFRSICAAIRVRLELCAEAAQDKRKALRYYRLAVHNSGVTPEIDRAKFVPKF